MLARQLQQTARDIVYRTRGQTHGPITRLMSPSDLGEILRPFVFLDLAGFDGRYAPIPMGFGWHPHSGIATVTVMLEGAVRYAETTGQEGVLPPAGSSGCALEMGSGTPAPPRTVASRCSSSGSPYDPRSRTQPTPV